MCRSRLPRNVGIEILSSLVPSKHSKLPTADALAKHILQMDAVQGKVTRDVLTRSGSGKFGNGDSHGKDKGNDKGSLAH